MGSGSKREANMRKERNFVKYVSVRPRARVIGGDPDKQLRPRFDSIGILGSVGWRWSEIQFTLVPKTTIQYTPL